MRIAYISYEYPPDTALGGIGTYVGQIARVMRDRGHEVEVFSASPARDCILDEEGVVTHLIGEMNRREFGIVAGHRFAARHRSKPFDILEGPEYNADARKAVQLCPGVAYVLRMHTPTALAQLLNGRSGAKQGWRTWLRGSARRLSSKLAVRSRRVHGFGWRVSSEWDAIERAQAEVASVVVPPCESLCEMARIVWGVPSERILKAPYPYVPTQELVALQPSMRSFNVGFIGRLEKRKGIETLVAAVPRIVKAVPEARFILIGASGMRSQNNEPYDQWVRRKLSAFGDRIEFLGKVPLEKMPAAYSRCDVCVFPSLWENFPNVCLEAMAAARAIVGSSAGGMKEMLGAGSAGCLISPGQPRELATAVIKLLQDPEKRLELGGLARHRVLFEYSASVVGELMERLYSEALQRHQSHLNLRVSAAL